MKTQDKIILKRDAMPFPFRWYDTLLALPENELRAMLAAMRDYAEKKVVPNFSGALAAAWNEIASRIDYDREKYLAICERNRENIRKRWETGEVSSDTTVYDRIRPYTKNTDGDGDGDGDIKETMLTHGKENASASASLFSFSGHEDGICQSSIQPGPNFKKWSSEQFTRSVDAAITERPEYAPHREAFIRYWTEPNGKGRSRFQLEKTWRTASRLATWHERNIDTRHDAAPLDVQAEIARMQEVRG